MFKFVYVKESFILSCRKDGKTLSGFMVSLPSYCLPGHMKSFELQKTPKCLLSNTFKELMFSALGR